MLLCKTFLSFYFVIKTLGKGKFQSASALRSSLGIILLKFYISRKPGRTISSPAPQFLISVSKALLTHSYQVVLFCMSSVVTQILSKPRPHLPPAGEKDQSASWSWNPGSLF